MNDLISLQKLFIDKVFRIPDYQRGYSWQDQQLTEFWEDVINIPYRSEHYTGMISLKEIRDIDDDKWNDEKWLQSRDYKYYHIIDGQQRLTTCIILINEIVGFIKNLPENQNKKEEEIIFENFTLKDIKERFLVISKPGSDNQLKSYIFGYETDNPSYEFFKSRILNEEEIGNVGETFYTLNLYNAKNFFSECLKALYKVKKLDGISMLFANLTQKIKFNIYQIQDDFNVFIAFETMNNRGKRLSTLELLKNRLIYLTTLYNTEMDTKTRVRRKINETWKDIYSYLGKNKQKSLDDDEFLQAHWIIYFGYSRNKMDFITYLLKRYFIQERVLENLISVRKINQLIEDEKYREDFFDEFEDDVFEKEDKKLGKLKLEDIGKYTDSLKKLIPYWYDLNFPEKSELEEPIKEALIKINRIGYAYFKPLICVVLSKKNIELKDKVLFLNKVERFIFLNFRLAGYFQTYRNSFYYNLSRDLYAGKTTIKEIIEALNKIDFIDVNGIINISPVLAKMISLFKYKGYYTWGGIRNFLYEYECYLTKDAQGVPKILPSDIFKKDDKDKVSIEHIYPQSGTNKYWAERFNKYNEQSRFYLANSLGNLLPLSMSINSSFQNDSFDDKKSGKDNRPRCYKQGSYSEMEVAKYDEWTPETIKTRGIKLLNFMALRYGFEFKSEEDKIQLLFLDRLTEATEDEKIKEIEQNSVSLEDFKVRETKNPTVIKIFEELHSYIQELNSSITFNITKNYVGYSLGKVFAEVHLQASRVKIFIMTGTYIDPQNRVKQCKVNWVNDKKIEIETLEKDDINYVKDIIKQSFNKVL